MKSLCLFCVSTLAATTASAQGGGFDPGAPCGEILRGASDTEKMMVGAWGLGRLAASEGVARPVDVANIRAMLGTMIDECVQDPQRSIAALLQPVPADQAAAAGSRADAERMLRRFFDPGEDPVALTAALAPTEADIGAVYGEPLAGKLTAMYARMFTPGVRIGPKPEQGDLLLWYATTAALKSGDPVLDVFPGGYSKVLPFFLGDQPIVRFKFVRAGEVSGLAFDGLIFVNGRWVLMPKPWRALQ